MEIQEQTPSPQESLATEIIGRIERLLIEADEHVRPLEVEPNRSNLFELFVMAEATGCLAEDSKPDLSCDGIFKVLAERWKLTDAARESAAQQKRLDSENLSRMRLLWSFMRMWMEWTYAWSRWPEFHSEPGVTKS